MSQFTKWWERMDIASRGLKTVHRTVAKSRLSNPAVLHTAAPTKSKINCFYKIKNHRFLGDCVIEMVVADGFEPSKSLTTDLQAAPFGHSGTLPYWSWWTDSNPRPADYKSAALPAELHQRF